MPFAPAGAVTGIGSLPLTSITSAIRSVAEFSPEVPFWPQLPRLSERESAIGQGLGILADLIEPRNEGYGYQVKEGRIDSVLETLHRSTGELTPANAAGFGAFEEALSSGLFRSAVAVKGQIEGPITLSAYLFHQGRPFLSDPALFALEDARVREAYAGLHCCAACPFERMCRAKPDILSFDAHEGLDLFFADSHALDFVNQGGTVAYGIVPTRPGLKAVDSATIFIRWLKAASLAGDPQKFAQRAMITATCGLGLLDTSSVAESFSVAHSISKLIRSLAGAPEY